MVLKKKMYETLIINYFKWLDKNLEYLIGNKIFVSLFFFKSYIKFWIEKI